MDVKDKLAAGIKAALADHGLEASEQWAYTNVGTFRVSRVGGFETLFSLHLDVQQSDVRMSALYPGETLVNSMPHKGDAFVGERFVSRVLSDANAMADVVALASSEAKKHGAAPAQYFVACNDDEGEDWSLFVTAKSPEDAVALWRGYYSFEDGDDRDCKVFEVPSRSAAPTVHEWGEPVLRVQAPAVAPGP